MKKLISAAAALAMAASMVGSAVPFATGAADAKKAFELRPYLNTDGSQASLEISADAISAGDVTIPIGLYLVESENDTQGFLAQWTVNSKDGDASNKYVSFKKFVPDTVYFDSDQTFTVADGSTIETNKVIGFAGTITSNRQGVKFNQPNDGSSYNVEDSYEPTNCVNAWGSVAWATSNDGHSWIGAKSDDFPVTVFTATFAKGTPAGTYTIDFVDQLLDPNIPGNYTCMVENDGKYTANAGNLDLKGVTITIGGGSTTPPTTEPPVTNPPTTEPPTTTAPPATNPPTTEPPVQGPTAGNRPESGNFDEFTITGQDIVLKPGESKEMEFSVKANGHKVILAQCEVDFPSELECDILGNDPSSYAFAHVPSYSKLDDTGTTLSLVAKDPETNDAAEVIESEPIAIVNVTAPSNAKDGVYYIGFKSYHVVEVSGTGVPPVPPVEFDAKVVYGSVTIGDPTPGTPPTTEPPTTTAPPATNPPTTTAPPATNDPNPNPPAGDKLYGDVNCDKAVNIADVVLLNKWLTNAASYDMSEQGKINADCCDEGTAIDMNDSRAIIYSIVHLVDISKNPTTAGALDQIAAENNLPK